MPVDVAAPLVRLTQARYGDGLGTPVSGGDPVQISAQMFDQDGITPNDAGLSNLFVAWGQFLDHDLSLSLETGGEILTAEGLIAPLHRSDYVGGIDGPRTPTNAITWQIDGSQIYGSTSERLTDLRSFDGGRLRMSEDTHSDMGLLPDATPATFMAGDLTGDDSVFLAGDIRANENPALASLHTLMAREHNYWADRLAEAHADWTDDQLFEGARQIVEYELQAITYDSWLPHLVGDSVGPDLGYDPAVDGQVSVEFSTAAFRFGHTMVSSTLPRMDDAGTETDDGDMAIMDAFFNPDPLREAGIDAIIRGQAASLAQSLDTKVVDDLNFFLATPDGVQGFSLVALNILRGQDHGLQSYVDTRAALLGDIDPTTLNPTDFSIVTQDAQAQAELAAVYDTVHQIDLWVGGLAEDAVDDTQMGPLFTAIIADQFSRTRAGDETFGVLDPALGSDIIADVRESSLAEIIQRNSEIDLMQADPFIAQPRGLDPQGDAVFGQDDDTVDLVACDVQGSVRTNNGNDTLSISGGTKIADGVFTGNGRDTVTMTSGTITNGLHSGNDADLIRLAGTSDVDTLHTGNGDDHVSLTQSASVGTIRTGNGDDTVDIGGRNSVDAIKTGNGDDTITISHGADVPSLHGGTGFDTLTITGGRYVVTWDKDDPASGGGTVTYLDEDGNPTGRTTRFQSIESIACFTAGTRVITASGTRAIEDIRAGDMVYTLDNGLQPVVWAGSTTVLAEDSQAPVHIAAGALGNLTPIEVSPQHRMLLSDWRCTLVCGDEEVLAPACHLINDQTIRRRKGGTVTYVHLLFAQHQIIFGAGIPSESFHPGQATLDAMEEAVRAEVLALFPDLATDDAFPFGPAARTTAHKHEIAYIKSIG